MNNIEKSFAKAKSEGRAAFIPYLTIGYPTLEKSEAAIDRLVEGGADIIELGVPFSDPFADGSVIRSAGYEALRNGIGMEDVLALAGRVRAKHPETGLVVFSYYNIIYSMGLDTFASEAAKAGVDGVLVVDLPLEERGEFLPVLRKHGLTLIPLISPNTPLVRVSESAEGLDDSFLYVITVKGTTGARKDLPPELAGRLEAVRSAVKIPVAAGFGVSTRAQADEIAKHADGFIVGSALVKRLGETGSLDGELLP